MGSLLDAVSAVPRNTGGQRHELPPLLARMAPEDAEDLKKLLADPDLNVTELSKQMVALYGARHAASTWKRWSKEVIDGQPAWER